MPDHVHLLAAFGREQQIAAVVSGWKRYTAKQARIDWQRGFFEHRLRSNESAEEKATYILQNPLRAGLVQEGEAWPFLLRLD